MGSKLSRVVFHPPPPSYQRDPNLIWLRSGNEQIPAFYLTRTNARYTLLFSHGNAEDLGYIIKHFREMSLHLQVNVFVYEYTGYGMSTGQASEAGVYSDVEAAFTYVRDVIGTDWKNIIPYGRSIGTAPSVHLAKLTAVRGIILQSPMMSIYRIPFRLRFTMWGDAFSNIDKIGDVCCPVFIIHGTNDEIVPVWHGEGLYNACLNKGTAYDPYVVQGADHNNLEYQAGTAFFGHIKEFLNHLDQAPISDKLNQQSLKRLEQPQILNRLNQGEDGM